LTASSKNQREIENVKMISSANRSKTGRGKATFCTTRKINSKKTNF